MPLRKAEATWNGDLRGGNGTMKLDSGAFSGKYSFGSRFEQEPGTNPEELIAAAHAGCFSMAFAAGLAKAGFEPRSVHTVARVNLEKSGEGFAITRIELTCEAGVPNIDNARFQELAEDAKKNCPVSKALQAVDIRLAATLRS